MLIRRVVVFAGMVLVLANTGCCRMCDRWCGPRAAQPVVAAQPVYAAPAPVVAQPAPAGQCCVPCCVPMCCQSPAAGGAVPQPVPAYGTNSWQKNYFNPGTCYCE
jgi:hypothetical protein